MPLFVRGSGGAQPEGMRASSHPIASHATAISNWVRAAEAVTPFQLLPFSKIVYPVAMALWLVWTLIGQIQW
jgi:hypothetical protein